MILKNHSCLKSKITYFNHQTFSVCNIAILVLGFILTGQFATYNTAHSFTQKGSLKWKMLTLFLGAH